MKRVTAPGILLLAAVGLAGCDAYDPTASTQSIELVKVSGGGKDLIILTEADRHDSLVVKVTDGYGRPLRGVTVNWTQDDPASVIEPAASITGADGTAWAKWTLAGFPGRHTATVHVEKTQPENFTFQVNSVSIRSIAQTVGSQIIRCIVTADGVLACTANSATRPRPMVVGQQFVTVAATTSGSAWQPTMCALGVDGSVWCAPVGPEPLAFARLSIPAARSLTAGTGTFCVATIAGEAWCWGSRAWGVMGDGIHSFQQYEPPTRVVLAGTDPVRSVDIGDTWACALSAGGVPTCWGSNIARMIDATASQGTLFTPRTITLGAPLTDLLLSNWGESACGRRGDGRPLCWGDSFQASRTDHSPRRTIGADAAAAGVGPQLDRIAAFNDGYLAISRDGSLYAWGSQNFGDIGGVRGPMRPAAFMSEYRLSALIANTATLIDQACVELAGRPGTVCMDQTYRLWLDERGSPPVWRGIPPIVPVDSL